MSIKYQELWDEALYQGINKKLILMDDDDKDIKTIVGDIIINKRILKSMCSSQSDSFSVIVLIEKINH